MEEKTRKAVDRASIQFAGYFKAHRKEFTDAIKMVSEIDNSTYPGYCYDQLKLYEAFQKVSNK